MNRHQRRAAVAAAAKQRGETPRETGFRDRVHMYEHNRPALERMITRGDLARLADAVVLIADMEDEYGVQLARHHGVEGEQPCGPEAIPTLIAAWERPNVVRLLNKTHPATASALSKWQHVHTPVLVVANGGVTLLGLDVCTTEGGAA